MTGSGSVGTGVSIGVLGPLRVDGPDGVVTVRGVKERTLLAVLTAHRGRTVPTPALMRALWGEEPPASAPKSMQTFVLRLRKASSLAGQHPSWLWPDGGGYRLAAPAEAVDAERFAALVTAARGAADAGRRREALDRLAEGLALWRGPAYVDFSAAAFAQVEARRLEEMRLTAVEESTGLQLELDGADAVVPELERLVGEHPFRERLWALLIRGLYRQGRQGEALGAFDRARHVLGEELGVVPGRELREVQAQVLAQDPRLDRLGDRVPVPADLVPAGPLIGRGRELDRLITLWSRAREGAAVRIVVRGPAAAGGLRVVQELAALVDGDAGAQVVSALHHPPAPRAGDARPWWLPTRCTRSGRLPGQLVVVLAREDYVQPDDAELIDLQPLAPDEARAVIGAHVRPADASRASAEILAVTTAWPADLEEAAARWARDAAAATVRDA